MTGLVDATLEVLDEALTALIGDAKAALPAAEDYDVVRADYANRLFDAFIRYAGGGSRTAPRNAAGRAIADDFPAAFYGGLADGGAGELDDDDLAWLNGRVQQELGFVDGALDWIKEQRDAETITEPAVQARVEMWVGSLNGVYQEGVLRGKKSRLLTWHYGDTDHCATCRGLNGQRHKASWYLARNFIPRKPGAAMECGGYRCQCWLEDDDGNVITIEA